jgi:hypothetical protein
MWLQVPNNITDVLWEASLVPASEESVERISRDWRAQGKGEDIRDLVRDLPVVSIGQPETWSLGDLYAPNELHPLLRTKADEADFYLVRFSCSFRPQRKQRGVEWARFLVRLLPDRLAQQPVAYDLYPREVTYEAKRDVKVTLGPSLKFQEVEAKLGEVGFGLQYPELQPAISASGIGEAIPSWDYEEAKGLKVLGSKWMHLLLKVPQGMETVRATLDVAADIRVWSWRLPVLAIANREQAREHLAVRLV